jgi:coproporphyrinogen III oxidase-like Fe-S oxidoreductase
VRYFKAGCDRLTELGYHQWSGHGFARSPEFDLLYHRCVYGTLGGIVSFGPAAISFGTDYVKWNHPGIEKYIDDMDRQLTPTFQIRKTRDYELTAKKVVTELPYYGFCHISDNDIIPEISDRLSELIDAGVVQQRNSKLVLSDTARYQYASAMFYLLPEYDKKAMGREIFSHCARLGEKLTIDMLWV